MLGLKNNRNEVTESYKSLILNLENSYKCSDIKIIAVVSYKGKEGKTTVCNGLAISLSRIKKKVLLIDCNLRKPGLKRMLKIKAREGLLDILLEDKEADKVIYKYHDNLDILVAGGITNKQIDIIESDKMNDVLGSLRDKYDFIIIDTPELESYTDAQVIANKSDGVLLIVREEKNNMTEILKAKKKLNLVKANILGVVLNESNIKID